jgi:hypothetical protein
MILCGTHAPKSTTFSKKKKANPCAGPDENLAVVFFPAGCSAEVFKGVLRFS